MFLSMKISIITVGMNHKKYLEALYRSLYDKGITESEFEAIYVDNCSTDGSVEWLQEKYPQVKTIVNSEPLGFGENNNKGVMASKGDYIGIVNPDIIFTEGCFTKIVNMIKTNLGDKSIVAPKLLNPDGTVQYSVRKFVTLKMMLHRWMSWENDKSDNKCVKEYLCKDIDQTKIQEVDWAMGAALFMNRETYAQLGGFDQRYFLYMEDEDLCLRAWKQRIPVIYYPEIELIHNHLRGSAHLSKKTWWHLKSLVRFLLKHGINVKRVSN